MSTSLAPGVLDYAGDWVCGNFSKPCTQLQTKLQKVCVPCSKELCNMKKILRFKPVFRSSYSLLKKLSEMIHVLQISIVAAEFVMERRYKSCKHSVESSPILVYEVLFGIYFVHGFMI